eukprot:g7453.t1
MGVGLKRIGFKRLWHPFRREWRASSSRRMSLAVDNDTYLVLDSRPESEGLRRALTQGTLPCLNIMVHGTWSAGVVTGDLVRPLHFGNPSAHQAGDFAAVVADVVGVPSLTASLLWSGVNSETARMETAKNLAGMLRALQTHMPKCLLNVLAHSHGSSVVKLALQTCARAAPPPLSPLLNIYVDFAGPDRGAYRFSEHLVHRFLRVAGRFDAVEVIG